MEKNFTFEEFNKNFWSFYHAKQNKLIENFDKKVISVDKDDIAPELKDPKKKARFREI